MPLPHVRGTVDVVVDGTGTKTVEVVVVDGGGANGSDDVVVDVSNDVVVDSGALSSVDVDVVVDGAGVVVVGRPQPGGVAPGVRAQRARSALRPARQSWRQARPVPPFAHAVRHATNSSTIVARQSRGHAARAGSSRSRMQAAAINTPAMSRPSRTRRGIAPQVQADQSKSTAERKVRLTTGLRCATWSGSARRPRVDIRTLVDNRVGCRTSGALLSPRLRFARP